MPNKSVALAALLSNIGKGNTVTLQSGTAAYTDSQWRIYLGGQELTSVIWLESASPRVGPCLLAVDTPPYGQSIVYVLGFTWPRDTRGIDIATVTTAADTGFCNLLLRDGTEFVLARYMSHYTPVINDTVFLIWRGNEPYIIGKFPFGHNTVRVPPPSPQPDLPRGTAYGTSQFPVQTYRVWDTTTNTWSTNYTRDIRLSATQYAVFIYGGVTKTLADKGTIESATIQLGRRPQFADLSTDITLSIYRSDAQTISDGEPTVQAGPYPITVPGRYRGEPLDLPLELAQGLAEGGSITIKSNTPITFMDGPANGYLNVKWRNV